MNFPLIRTALLALAGWLVAGETCQASNLDQALLENSGQILEKLVDKHYKHVGVLPFQVKKGTRKASFLAAPLSLTLPGRLENALVLTTDGRNKLTLLHDVADTARKAMVGSYLTSETEYRKLFAQRYPLAWEGPAAKADAFLTGVVESVGDDRSRAKVIVAVLDATSWKDGKPVAKELLSFEVKTDRSLLADLGYGFALSSKALQTRFATKRNTLAVKLVASREVGAAVADAESDLTSANCTPDNVGGFKLEVLYDGIKQPITATTGAAGSKDAEYRVPTGKQGSKIELVLTRLADESEGPLGLVLRVNGVSTFDMETVESDLCRKWVIPAAARGKPQVWEGFYSSASGKNTHPFEALSEHDSAKAVMALGSRAGWIDLDVYASKRGKKDDTSSSDLPISIPRSTGKVVSMAEYQKRLMAATRLKVKNSVTSSRGLIMHSLVPTTYTEIPSKDLPNPEHVARLSIRYYAEDDPTEPELEISN